MIYPGHKGDTTGLCFVGIFLESMQGDRHKFNKTIQHFRCQDGYLYISFRNKEGNH